MSKKWMLCTATLVALLMMTVAVCAQAATVQVGDIITFGRYEQDNVLDNGPEPIEWTVFSVEGNEAELLSKYVLDAKPWNAKGGRANWETNSSLRLWLNDEFYNAAFTDEEKAVMITREVDNYVKGGRANPTADPVYLISQFQADDMATSWEPRRALPTAYAIANGIRLSTEYDIDGSPTVLWWTRSPSWEDSGRAGYVGTSGGVIWCGAPQTGKISNQRGGVRPVIVVNLDLLK